MSCYNCNKRAIWQYDIDGKALPLCLDCHLRFQQAQELEVSRHERMLNYLNDEMCHVVGLPPSGPRFPSRRPIQISAGTTLNNININNSNVGVINSGSIETVDLAITSLQNSGNLEFAQNLKAFSNEVIASTLSKEAKNEIVEALSVISEEAVKPEKERRKSLIKLMIDKVDQVLEVSSLLSKTWLVFKPLALALTTYLGN